MNSFQSVCFRSSVYSLPYTFCLSSAPPRFLPISSTPQPERHTASQRRHSIEKETPTSVRLFMPPSRQSSRSLVCCSAWSCRQVTGNSAGVYFRPLFQYSHFNSSPCTLADPCSYLIFIYMWQKSNA